MKIKIKSAKDSKTNKVYELKELLDLPDDSEILRRLVCVNCGCLLTFNHASAKRGAHLKTRNRQNHDSDCADYFEREERKELQKTGEIVSGRLDTKAMQKRLKTMRKRLFNPNPTEDAKPKPKSRKNKPSGETTPNTERKLGTRIIPTTTPTAGIVDGERSGHVHMTYREIGQLSKQSLGQTVMTGGYLKEVSVSDQDEEHATIVLEFKGHTLKLKLYPDIFQYQQGLHRRIESLHAKLGLMEHQVEVTSAVEIGQDVGGNLEAILRDESAIDFDGQRLTVFLSIPD